MTTRRGLLALRFDGYLTDLLRHVPDDGAFRRQAFELMRGKFAHELGTGRGMADVIGEIAATCATKLRARKRRPGPERWHALSSALIRVVHDRNALDSFADAWKGDRSRQLENALRFSVHLAADLIGRIEGVKALGKPIPANVLTAYFDTSYAIARHLEANCLALTAAGKRFGALTRKTLRLLWKIVRLDPDRMHRLSAGEAIGRLKKARPAAPQWTDARLDKSAWSADMAGSAYLN